MKQIKYIFVVLVFAFWLVGCQSTPSEQSSFELDGADLEHFEVITEDAAEEMPTLNPNKDWNQIFPQFVNRMARSASSYKGNRVLLMSDLRNRSNEDIDLWFIESILHNSMQQQKTFTVVDRDDIILGKEKIGISTTDRLVSRSKTIALAKSLDADYVLFTTIYRAPSEDENANISMELLYTKTGEIIKRVTSAQLIAQQKKSVGVIPLKPAADKAKPSSFIPGIN